MANYMEKKINTKYIDIAGATYVEVKVSVLIKDQGIREQCTLQPLPVNLENVVNYLTDKCLSEFDILNNKVVPINQSNQLQVMQSRMQLNQQQPQNQPQQQVQQEVLSDKELNAWSDKAMRIMGNEIERLKKNKRLLNIQNNQQLEQYIQQFSNGQLSKAQEIIPRNIADFNNYLESLVSNQQVS